MKASRKTVVATLVVIGAAICALLLWDPLGVAAAPTAADTTPRVDRPNAAPPKTQTDQANAPDVDAGLQSGNQRVPIANADSPPAPKTPAQAVLTVVARCIDAQGKPIARAHLIAPDVASLPRATSDPDGRVTLAVDWPTKVTQGNRHFLEIEVGGDGLTRLSKQLSVAGKASETFALGDLVLERSAGIAGMILDVDGSALADARVWIARGVQPAQGAVEERRRVFGSGFRGLGASVSSWANTDAMGRFHIDGLPVASVSVVARHPGRMCTYSEPLTLVPGKVTTAPTLTMGRVPNQNLIAGWVRDAEGQPIPGARVAVYENRGRRNVNPLTTTAASQPDGAFKLVVLAGQKYTIEAEQRTRQRQQTLLHDIASGNHEVVVAFVPGRAFTLVATGPGGAAINAVSVVATEERGSNLRIESQTTDDGALRIVAPSQRFRLWVQAKGYLRKRIGPFEPISVPKRIEVELQPVGRVTGRITASGQPVAGAAVHLHYLDPKANLYYFAPKIYTRLEAAARSTVKTDASGQFELQVHRAGRYVLHASVDGHARGESREVDLAPGTAAAPIAITLLKPATLVGQVLVGPNKSPEGQIIAATRGDGHAEVCVADADGRFRFEGLMPGGWQVRPCRPDDQRWLRQARTWTERTVTELPVDVQLYAGETATFDVDLFSRESAEIVGRLVIDGVSCSGWKVSLLRDTSYVFAKTGADGAFKIRGAKGETSIHFFGHLATGGELAISQTLSLVDGANPLTITVQTGGVDLLGLPAPAPPKGNGRAEGYALVWPKPEHNGPTFVYRFHADASGNHQVAALPAGTPQLRRRTGKSSNVNNWETIADVLLAPGQHQQVTPKK